jgi:hypothetical protein
MRRFRLIDITAALAAGAIGFGTLASVLAAPSVAAEPQASRTCITHGLMPNSVAYEQCVSRVTRAFEWGEREMAFTLARIARDARSLCINSGIKPASVGFQSCMDREIDARSLLVFTDDQIHTRDWPSPTIASQ